MHEPNLNLKLKRPSRRKSDKWHSKILSIISLAVAVLSVVYISIDKFPDIYDRITATTSKIEEKNSNINKLTANMLTSIQYNIEDLLIKLNADRIYVAELHNGTATGSGRSFEKFSYTFEKTSQVIAKESERMQSIPLTFVNFSIQDLFDKSKCYTYNWDYKQPNTDDLAERWFKRTNVKTTKIISIVTPTGLIIGFLGVEYILEEHTFTTDDSANIKECIASIKHSLIQLKELNIIR